MSTGDPDRFDTIASLAGREREPAIPIGWHDLRMIIRLDRDSVAAGDDVEGHDVDWEADARRPLERFVHDLVKGGYLPGIQGGRSTWVARGTRRGEPFAVLAIRFGRLDSMRLVGRAALDLGQVGESLYFDYRAQEDPDAVFAASELLTAGVGPIEAIKVLRSDGLSLEDAKAVVHRSLPPDQRAAAERLWDVAESALDSDGADPATPT